MRRMILKAAVIAATLLAAEESSAATTIWLVSGHVTQVVGNPSLAGAPTEIALGDSFLIQFTFDPATAVIDNVYSPTFIGYGNVISDTQFSIGTNWAGGISAQAADSEHNDQIAISVDDPNSGFQYDMGATKWFTGHPHQEPGLQITFNSQAWNPGGSSFIDSLNILTQPYDIGAGPFINGPTMQLSYFTSQVTVAVSGTPDSIRVLSAPLLPVMVPEPTTWSLMLTGFGLAGLALRRRRMVVPA